MDALDVHIPDPWEGTVRWRIATDGHQLGQGTFHSSSPKAVDPNLSTDGGTKTATLTAQWDGQTARCPSVASPGRNHASSSATAPTFKAASWGYACSE
ncbi:hypothetical protein [Streptomyces enissocaesilis]|uniref:Uncharacterized protein n=1 Tax=Streptomyces enissocaesilis TaxID=332589 RepID=A0ABN3X6Y5_9ACTN